MSVLQPIQVFCYRKHPAATGGSFLLERGYLLLIVALVQATLASLLLIAFQLWLWKSKLGIEAGSGSHLPILATLIAMQFGFTVLIFLAVCLYGIATWYFPKLTQA
ncbi:MAG: hypothetical protein Q8L79_08970 [Methylobacter sp.]|uniref:hypothetical protein n=1 Tax=Methylobacter sp. TaxID=2051955 RepID=UPI00272FA15A|nr:hypothetical protein [Methylobacter sp.]MDP1665245.1 hypothetical protein [Methylobacter sp.]